MFLKIRFDFYCLQVVRSEVDVFRGIESFWFQEYRVEVGAGSFDTFVGNYCCGDLGGNFFDREVIEGLGLG